MDEEELQVPILNNEESNELGELKGCGALACCNPLNKWHRFIALFFMCFLGFGSYFCFDNPGALQDNFKADLGLTTTQFVMLYSFYSWPNVVLCFIGGFLLDRVFGVRLGTIIYMTIVLIGQALFALGGLTNAFWLMLVGRFIFGIGAESLAVAQNNYAVLWFKGKELNMVFGLQLSFARVGSTVNFIVMEPLYKWVGKYYQGYTCTGIVLFIAGSTCVLSLICCIVLGWMDKRAARITKRNENSSGEVASLMDVKTFKPTFWLVTVICVSYYVAIFPFVALGKVFFERKFDFSPEDANTVNSIVYIMSAVASPVLGFLVDKTGRNLVWVLISVIITIGGHGVLAFTFVNPYVGMCTIGLAYSMLASGLWPLVSLIIPEYQLGTAYGICQSVQNLGLAVVSLISGRIVDQGGFLMLEMFFLGCLFVALIATVLLWIVDLSIGGGLNMSPSQRESLLSQLRADVEREKLLEGSESMDEVTPEEIEKLRAENNIRNRYVSRIVHASDAEPLLE